MSNPAIEESNVGYYKNPNSKKVSFTGDDGNTVSFEGPNAEADYYAHRASQGLPQDFTGIQVTEAKADGSAEAQRKRIEAEIAKTQEDELAQVIRGMEADEYSTEEIEAVVREYQTPEQQTSSVPPALADRGYTSRPYTEDELEGYTGFQETPEVLVDSEGNTNHPDTGTMPAIDLSGFSTEERIQFDQWDKGEWNLPGSARAKSADLLNAEKLIYDATNLENPLYDDYGSTVNPIDQAEEQVVPQLQNMLDQIPVGEGQTPWLVEEDIGYGLFDYFAGDTVEGSGSMMPLSNNITITNPNGVKRNFNIDNSTQLRQEVAKFMIADKTHSAEHVEEVVGLREELATAFNDNPELYGEILDPSKMTLADRAAYKDDPTEYLRAKVHEHVGGFSWWGEDRKEGYTELSNMDINGIVEEVFNLNLSQERPLRQRQAQRRMLIL